jgi:hypothetical protein
MEGRHIHLMVKPPLTRHQREGRFHSPATPGKKHYGPLWASTVMVGEQMVLAAWQTLYV